MTWHGKRVVSATSHARTSRAGPGTHLTFDHHFFQIAISGPGMFSFDLVPILTGRYPRESMAVAMAVV